MKKILIALLALCLMLGVTTAFAASKPTVAFTASSGNVNGGYIYQLGVKISKAQDTDTAVEIKNNTTGEVFTVIIPAGELKVTFPIETEPVEKGGKNTFSFVKSNDYQTGTMHTMNIRTLPKVQFYSGVNHGVVGKEMTVLVLCKNPGSVCKGNNVFTLKDHNGNVLAEREWSNPNNRIGFKFTVTEEMYGRTDLTVWLGDNCVSPDDGYMVVSREGEKVIRELETELPIMGIGIDCGFEGRKTYKVLEVLEKHNVKVTFFMTGYFLREFPEEAKAIFEAGHEIATHSNTHKHLPQLSAYQGYEQITIPIWEAEELLGVTPRLFRPPYGEYKGFHTAISRAEGMEVIMWGPTYHDSTGKYTEKQIMKLATTGNDYKPGTIVLCHVNGYYQPDSLDAGLTHYESLGLKVVPISAMLCASGHELPPMPYNREALVYTNEYWETWIEREMPELLGLPAEEETVIE